MKKNLLVILFITGFISVSAQDDSRNIKLKFSGFVRGDVIYNTRNSVAALEDLFFLYPKDHLYDELGNDLNAQPTSGFYSLSTRATLDVSGAKVWNSDLSGKIEADFAGTAGVGGTPAIVRLRLAYLKMDWDKSSLLIGQTWHPMFGNIQPEQLTLSTGAPFQPFNRSPQIRYDYRMKNFVLTASAIYQLQNNSVGFEGKSNVYSKKAILPELNGIIDYKYHSIQAGLGINFLTLKPRTQSIVNGKIYKVEEILHSISYMAYFKYTEQLLSIGLKTVYGQNNTHLNMLGGFGVYSIDPVTGKCDYTNFNYGSSWLNIAYGKMYKGNFLLGYTKNFGTEKSLVEGSTMYGNALTIDNMYRLAGNFSYNVSHFSIGLEYEFINANYGDEETFDWKEGKYSSTHSITDHRITGVIKYNF